ncbi:MAG TPA: competence/damage-inducible protein A [Solirubrobacteraceae bacterium]|nr:competence/damage-inducible protein A [Solirubrobacteraceae bacterium]
MSARAGIVVTGTEVLTGRVSDRNGPWLADRLRELGVDLAYTTIVGDRPQDMLDALRFMADHGIDLVLTSGGLGPTADDLTAEVVGEFQSRPMVLDAALEGRIAEILAPLAKRWPNLDMEAIRAGNRKQATIPEGSTVLEPIGTAPGLVVPPPDPSSSSSSSSSSSGAGRGGSPSAHGTTVVVLPGPPREPQPMWAAAVRAPALQAAVAGATVYRQRMLRMFGIPESEIAETLRVAGREGVPLERLEVTTCLKRGEVEVVTRYEPDSQEAYEALERVIRSRHSDTLFSDDGTTVDEQVAALLRGTPSRPARTVATAESCTGGLLAGRLTDLAGASEYVKGGIVAYSNDVKVSQAGVPERLIERHGAVSAEVARSLADGARTRLGADFGVGVTGVAGPGGGSEEKPVGLVWLSVTRDAREPLTRSINLPGSRADIRDRATTVAIHLLRRALLEP